MQNIGLLSNLAMNGLNICHLLTHPTKDLLSKPATLLLIILSFHISQRRVKFFPDAVFEWNLFTGSFYMLETYTDTVYSAVHPVMFWSPHLSLSPSFSSSAEETWDGEK